MTPRIRGNGVPCGLAPISEPTFPCQGSQYMKVGHLLITYCLRASLVWSSCGFSVTIPKRASDCSVANARALTWWACIVLVTCDALRMMPEGAIPASRSAQWSVLRPPSRLVHIMSSTLPFQYGLHRTWVHTCPRHVFEASSTEPILPVHTVSHPQPLLESVQESESVWRKFCDVQPSHA